MDIMLLMILDVDLCIKDSTEKWYLAARIVPEAGCFFAEEHGSPCELPICADPMSEACQQYTADFCNGTATDAVMLRRLNEAQRVAVLPSGSAGLQA